VRVIVIALMLGLSLSVGAVELTGPLTQGGMVLGKTVPGNKIYLDNQSVRVTPEGVFVIGFGRDAKPEVTLVIEDSTGAKEQKTLQVKAREYNIQRVNGIKKKIMSPSEEDLKRIRADSKAVKQARAQMFDDTFFASKFQWPLIGRITGVFGSQRVYNGKPGRPHYGIDIAAPKGTVVTAPAPGTISLVHPDMFYSGGTLIIDHGYGVSSTFLHLSKILVKEGDKVKPGDSIAEVGSSGRSTGPHLDWRMNWLKTRVDPSLLVEPMPKKAAP